MRQLAASLLLSALICPFLVGQNVQVRVHTLKNGMRFLLVPRRGDPNIAAGWVAKVGSVDERPGITGTAHLFEHMMFKGTRVIGTRDIAKDLEVIAKLDQIKKELAREEEKLRRKHRLGEIDDPADPGQRTEAHSKLLARFQELLAEQKALVVKDEFDRIYSGAGASGMNAGTTNDFTIYFINVPANKLELWFWMESGCSTPFSASSTASAMSSGRRGACGWRAPPPESSRNSSKHSSGARPPTAGRSSAGRATSRPSPVRRP